MFDDVSPKPKPESKFPRDLENLSVLDLKVYIDALKEEIGRVEADIERKKESQKDAEAFFE